MGQRTALYPLHIASGAKIVDFAGWDMPVHYGSQIEEHHAVRQDAGMCDVSHMAVVDVAGANATPFLRRLLCNDVAKLDTAGKALYSGMLNDEGGLLDDLIVYRDGNGYRLVVNCATREKDLTWMERQSGNLDVTITERADLGIVAVQGPNSLARVKSVVDTAAAAKIDTLKPFTSCWHGDWFVARTGYTGEVGLEIILPATVAPDLWQRLAGTGVRPVGLGARDTLRLEAGMNLYGHDMDESVNPFESNMAFTVAMDADHEFVGKAALSAAKEKGIARHLVGLVMQARGVLRQHYPVFSGDRQVGRITSGAFSPTLQHSIALARLSDHAESPLTTEIRGKRLPVFRVRPPFVRNGKQVYKPIDEILN